VWVSLIVPTTDNLTVSLPEFIDFRDQSQSLEGLAAFGYWNVNLTGVEEPERLQGILITADAFRLLGVDAAVGRTLVAADDAPGADRVVVLGDKLWRRLFGADPGIVGRSLTLNGESYTVAGILPPDFLLPSQEAELAAPLAPEVHPWRSIRSSVAFLRIIGRLKPGISRQQAAADLGAISLRQREQFPVEYAQRRGVKVGSLHEQIAGRFRLALWLLLGAVILVLLIACANLANLQLARTLARRGEFAIRAALGASRPHLLRQLLAEGLVLAAAGGALGLMLTSAGVDTLRALSPADLPRIAEARVDGRCLAFTLGVSLLVGLILGLAPLVQTWSADLRSQSSGGLRGAESAASSSRIRALLVLSELTLAFVLLIGAGLFLRSYLRVQGIRLGFEPADLLVARLSLPADRFPQAQQIAAFSQLLEGQIEALPGAEGAGVVNILPLSGLSGSVFFNAGGPPPLSQEDVPVAQYRSINPGYLEAMATSPLVVLISESVAKRSYPDSDPIGARFFVDDQGTGRMAEIVGVVSDVRQLSLDGEPTHDIYVPIRQVSEEVVTWIRSNMFWVVRTRQNPMTLAAAFRREVHALDRDVATSSLQTMERYIADAIAGRRFSLQLLAIFGGAALLIAMIGIYAMMAISVAQRTREIGIRLALGAVPRKILWDVLGRGMQLTAIGIAVGIALTLALARVVGSLLFEVSGADPGTLTVTSLAFAGTALLACYVAGRRATRVDPLVALNFE
jgi:putative ABC transport system permease protein